MAFFTKLTTSSLVSPGRMRLLKVALAIEGMTLSLIPALTMVGTMVVCTIALVCLFSSNLLITFPLKSHMLDITMRVKNDWAAPVRFSNSSTDGVIMAGICLALILTMAWFNTSIAVSLSGMDECPPEISTVRSMLTNPFSPVPITATGLPTSLKRWVSICPPSSNTNAGLMLFSLNHFEKMAAPLFPAISSSCPNAR